MMRYLYRKEEKTPDLDEVLPKVGPEAAEFVMGFIQRLEEKGREEGRTEGREEGREEAEVRLLLSALSFKFGAVPPEVVERLRAASSAQRERWNVEGFAAQSLDDLFSL